MVVLYHGLYWSGAVSSNRVGTLLIKASVVGWLGVNLFFVLSGFLITGILLDSKGRPAYYRRFYQRRVVRILPAYLVTIAVLLPLHFLTVGSALIALVFLTNYDIFPVVGHYGAFWSLSVEEQFYLFWPLLVAKVSVRVLTFVAIALCIVEPILRWLSASGTVHLGDTHTSTLLIADNLALGALIGIFTRSRFGSIKNGRRLGITMILAGIAIMAAGIPFDIFHRTNRLGAAFQTLPWNVLFAGIVVFLLALQSPVFGSLWTAPLRFLGYISYGLYLYHLIIYFRVYDVLVRHISNASLRISLQGAFARLFLAGALSIFISWLSRKYFEEYFLRLKSGSTS